MIKTFITSLKLDNTCKVNKMINSLKTFTKVSSNISSDLYSNKWLKLFAGFLTALKTIIELFGSKIFVVFLLYGFIQFSISEGFFITGENNFFHIFLLISISECYAQSNLLDDGDNTYYAILLLKINAKKYILSNYCWKIFLRLISFLTVFIILKDIIGLSISTAILYSFFNIMLKTIFNYFRVKDYTKCRNTMIKLIWPVTIVCTLLAFLLPILKITISIQLFYILCVFVYIYGLYSFYKLAKFDGYYKMYKEYLKPESKLVENKLQSFNMNIHNNININNVVNEKQKGFKYLNSLFTARHKKKIYLSMILQIIITILEYIIIIYCSVYDYNFHKMISHSFTFIYFLIAYGAYFMGALNADRLTISWFEDCDHAMLNFKVFRINKNILVLFRERFILLIKVSILPILIMSIGATIIYKINIASQNILDYFVVFILSILIYINTIMNGLLMYYIIQPNSYSENLKKAINNNNFATMINIICCMTILLLPILLKLSIQMIGLATILYTILHICLGFYAIYKLATKTFRVKN